MSRPKVLVWALISLFFTSLVAGAVSADESADSMAESETHTMADDPEPMGAASHDDHHSRADAHGPIGVMGDHMHDAGEFMFSYRYMRMNMNGNRDGSERVASSTVLRRFPVTPTDMDMEMHMFGAMWAPSDRVTLMAMAPLLRLDMKHKTRSGRRFTTRAKGLGDIKVSALIGLLDTPEHKIHLNAGLSLPTGSISVKDDTPLGRTRLPYPMQLGSGTWDLLPGITYTGFAEKWSWGSQLRATWRTGLNNKGYRLGHGWGATGWVARSFAPWLSSSVRLDYRDNRNYRGDDDDLIRGLIPTADPDRRAGRRLDLLLGLNFEMPSGPLQGHRLAIELGRPVMQHLDGPQLETDWLATFGWQKAF